MSISNSGSGLGNFSGGGSSKLGSLAQSARQNHLKQARRILIGLGILFMLLDTVLFFFAPEMVKKAIDAEIARQGPGFVVDAAQRQETEAAAVAGARGIIALEFGVGFVLVILGILVYKFPVPCTVLGLILYLGDQALGAYLDPKTLAQGLVIKTVVIIVLVKAVKAAIAYTNEQKSVAGGFD